MARLSPLKWLARIAELTPQHAKRAEAILDTIPHISNVYSPDAIADAFSPHSTLTTLTPREFKSLAFNLPDDQAQPYVDHYADLIRKGDWVEPPPRLFLDHYVDRMRSRPFEGFSEVPFLDLMLDPASPKVRGQVIGHEGRHRNRVIEQLYSPEEETLVRIRPSVPDFIYGENPGDYSVFTKGRPKFSKGGLNQCHMMGSPSKPNGR